MKVSMNLKKKVTPGNVVLGENTIVVYGGNKMLIGKREELINRISEPTLSCQEGS